MRDGGPDVHSMGENIFLHPIFQRCANLSLEGNQINVWTIGQIKNYGNHGHLVFAKDHKQKVKKNAD